MFCGVNLRQNRIFRAEKGCLLMYFHKILKKFRVILINFEVWRDVWRGVLGMKFVVFDGFGERKKKHSGRWG